jgi:hypothetical protein
MRSDPLLADRPPGELRIGALGFGASASVDSWGAVRARGVTLDWWVGADDRWHVPAQETTTRQQRPFTAPVAETMVRIPSGDAVHRAYGAAADGRAVTVVEIENRSPAPFTLALVVTVAGKQRIEIDGAAVLLDGEVVLVLPRAPGAWAAASATREIVMSGAARTDRFEPVQGPIEITLLFPVSHRTTWRAALAGAPVDVRALPDADSVARGWDLQLERGMQAVLPSPIGERVDAARADLLLAPPTSAVVAALEDWGFDAEAADGWAHLGWSDRRRARKRTTMAEPWTAMLAVDARAEPAQFLTNLRAVLVRDSGDDVELLPGFPPDWLGQPITVDGVPRHDGVVSFAVRWHGPRPALLWDAPAGVQLRAPALDPAWSSAAPAGETLLAEPPKPLLAMGAGDRSAGTPVAAPGQFS